MGIKSIKSIKMSSAMIFGEWRECMVCMANNKRSCENGRTANLLQVCSKDVRSTSEDHACIGTVQAACGNFKLPPDDHASLGSFPTPSGIPFGRV